MPTRKKKRKLPPFIKYMCISLMVLSIILLGIIFLLNVLPIDYFITLVCVIVIIVGLLIYLMINKKTRIVSSLISFMLIIVYVLGILYSSTTYGFLEKITNGGSSVLNYEVLVLKNSDYNDISDVKNKTIGVVETIPDKSLERLDEEGYFEIDKEFSTEDLATSLLNGELDALLILDSEYDILKEHYINFESQTKVIYTFSLKVKDDVTAKNIDVTKSSFNILVSGIDTYGTIGSLSRSDVNMVVTVNPLTKEIVLTSIPRDYYVDLYGKNAKDKLAHVGIYGMETTVKTIEDLLDIEINYYVKFNFSSLIKIVDAIGGIELDNPTAFTADYYDEPKDEWVKFSFKQGKIKLDGERALAFARERKVFAEGDIKRAKNQQLVIEAVLDKVLSPSIISKYSNLLKSLENTFLTNMSRERITNFIKMEIKDGGHYNINNLVLNGTSDYAYTYSYPNSKLYVMIPNEEQLLDGKNEINRVYYNKEDSE